MKTIMLIFNCLIFTCSLNAFQLVCVDVTDTVSAWEKQNISSINKWGIDESSLDLVRVNGSIPTKEYIKNLVDSNIRQWLVAIHGGNDFNIINFVYTDTFALAEYKVRFWDFGEDNDLYCGDYFPAFKDIRLNSYNTKNWSPTGLSSTILHEIGHILLGGGHPGSRNAIMYTDPCHNTPQIITVISNCEKAVVRGYYNPEYNVKVTNKFGDGNQGSGIVAIENSMNLQNVPDLGYLNYNWLKSSFPHTLIAVNNQSISSPNGKIYNRKFNQWNDPQNTLYNAQNISITPIEGMYSANFYKEYNINLLPPQYIETNSNGYYTIDGSTLNSTTVLDNSSKTFLAVPNGSNWVVIDWLDNDSIRFGNPINLKGQVFFSV